VRRAFMLVMQFMTATPPHHGDARAELP